MISQTLTERRQKVLHIVIQEYVRTGQPVSSKKILDIHNLGVSAATIRNDLAALEEKGLLTHPHTSAGRVPTDAGYRYYVEYLIAEEELSLVERRRIRAEFSLARQELDQWLRLSTTVLANATQGAALATAPRASMASTFKHVELVAIQDRRVLLVLVLQSGTVKQQLLDLDKPAEQATLTTVSNELNDRLIGENGAKIQQSMAILSPFAKQIALLIVDLMERIDNREGRQIYRDGLAKVLDAHEFVDSESVRTIVQILEERTLLEQVVGDYDYRQGIQVIIAGDGRYSELQEIGLVIGQYGSTDHATGILGVVGPLHMSYGRTISAVRFVSTLMSDVVQEIHG